LLAEEPIAEEPIAEEPIAEEPIAEEPSLVSKDEQLERVKRHLDQGDFDQALPLINRLLEENIYTQTLELWIKQAIESQAKTTSEAWAILGDITLQQNKPGEAFDAYAKAIKYLLINNEVNDETR
jgi:tetratricopeptide (TPR) repeat protein